MIKKFFWSLAVPLVVSLGVLIVMAFNFGPFGTRPGSEHEDMLKRSPQYNATGKIFKNRRPDITKEMRKRAMTLETFQEWFRKGEDRSPSKPLPEVKPDIAEFLKPSDDIKVIWFGHSTFLLNFSGKIILVDPVFSGSASPFSFAVKRFQKPVLTLAELPRIDFVVISHDHYDHLDMESIKFFVGKSTPFLTPLGVGSHLVGWGIEKERITELDWWETFRAGGIEFIAAPAQHFSGRDGIHENATLWASWVIRDAKHKIYFSGDSGYDTHFKDIGDKYGPFDLAFVESGQYNEKWREVHLMPDEFYQTYVDLKAKRYFPVHWGMFELSLHPWFEPIVKLTELAAGGKMNLVTPKLGEVITINEKTVSEPWWTDLL